MIYIPFGLYSGVGGPVTFMKNLHEEFDLRGFKYGQVFSPKNGIFFPIDFDIVELEKVKNYSAPIIQRLDGIYYPEKHGDRYLELNKKIKDIYQNYSTHIIFQSEYSRKQCFSLFGEKQNYTIIHNGCNQSIFCPNKKEKGLITRFITTGNFRNIDMLEPVILALDEIFKEHQIELRILGPVVNEELKPFIEREYVDYLGETSDMELIASHLQKSDAFIYSHLNPPCPNSVIEAISVGLPIVGFDSGSMSELCSFSKELLAPVNNKVFQKYSDFDWKKLKEALLVYLDKPDYFNELALEHSKDYSIEVCASKYNEVFKKFKSQKTFFQRLREIIRG